MSFAVDKGGEIFSWGLNKNNCLLVNDPERSISKTIVEEPLPMNLPPYFVRGMSTTNIVQNASQGFDVYTSEKPVKSKSSTMERELEKVREECSKLRKKVKDNQTKLNKMNAGAMQTVDEGGEEDADANETNQQFEKLCENDKVIRSIKELIQRTKHEKLIKQQEYKSLQFDLRSKTSEVETLNKAIEDLEKKERDILKEFNEEIQKRQEMVGNSKEKKDEFK